MISLEEAQHRLLGDAQVTSEEVVDIADSYGHILARSVIARLSNPAFALSAMDGYAIRAGDGGGPWRVVGVSAAGTPFDGTPGHAEAVRIFTGAPLPEGADTILIQENAARDGDRLSLIGESPPRGAFVRATGMDFAIGDTVAKAGATVTPALAGLLAAAGHVAVVVRRRPRVAILATGDELVPPGATPGPSQIVNSNGVILGAMLRSAGAEVVDLGIVRDDLAELASAIAEAAKFDLLVTVGGASVGDHDLVRPALERAGAHIDFWKVALKPGKPAFVGRLGGCRVLGLPGNPVSAYVCALLFGVPLIRTMLGDPSPLPSTATATTAVALPANGSRRDFMRAMFRDGIVTPAPVQDSSMLSVLAASNALLVRLPNNPPVAAGEQVVIIRLDRDSFAS